jgi:hypothetical protein
MHSRVPFALFNSMALSRDGTMLLVVDAGIGILSPRASNFSDKLGLN